MPFPHNRKSLFLFFLVMLVLLLCAGLSACSPAAAAVTVTAEGAFEIPALDQEIRLRAYRPDVELLLEWEEEGGAPVEIVVENMAASTAVEVIPEGGQEWADPAVVFSAPACLTLSVEGSGRQRLLLSPVEESLSNGPFFALVGDSQGHNEVLAEIIEEVNRTGVDFLICLGDLVASGSEAEYAAFQETMEALECPYYAVPGNHDIREGGFDHYSSLLGPVDYHFDYGGYRFVFADSSALDFTESQRSWLSEVLDGELPGFIFLHVPPLDPRENDHSFLDPAGADAFLELIAEPGRGVQGVFSGHIHLFHHRKVSGIDHVVSGGGGAALYATAEEGGFHHYTLCRVGPEGLAVEAVKVEAPPRSDELVVSGSEGDLIFTAEELDELAVLEQELSFQNRLYNYGGKGIYRGVPVSDLLEKVGGMEPDDTLMVYALDGYAQAYAYGNVYPESCGWEERQGPMALAISFDGETVPEWREGYRIAFFPEDGVYDNEDCAHTSAEGQGWHIYESAGGRWVKTVVRLEIVQGGGR
jgi:predicted phosphodiesterase